ncbi:MAG: VanW family protein [Gaiellaceae bacterium]
MAVLEASRARRARRLPRLATGLLALVAAASVATGALAGRTLLHRGEVMPGVQVLGADLGGLGREAAAARIERVAAPRLRQPIELDVGAERVTVVPAELFRSDTTSTVTAALAAGRDGWGERARSLLAPLTPATELELRLVRRPDAAKRLRAVLRPYAKPPVAAKVSMDGLEPVVSASRPGLRPDLAGLLAALQRRSAAGDGPVPVVFRPSAPAVGDAAARAAAEEARLVVSAPVALTFDGRVVARLSAERLAELLTFKPHSGRLLVLFADEKLAAALAPAVEPFTEQPVDATFDADGTRAWVVPAKPGLGLDPDRSLVAVTTAAHERGERTAALELKPVPAELTTGAARALGIRERISSFTTELGPSSSNRIHNVHLMADYIDATIVKPGAVFSFNKRVGPRTAERGFLEGQMIVGSLLLPSIGGGVCQTATTLFNNAFELGLPILERHNHSFYISHYPLGRDATVSWGGPDFKFRNDLERPIVIKTSYTDSTLTFTFYGRDQGRKVVARTGERTNWRQPGKTYALDPAAPRGSVRLERGAHQAGFDVTVYRTVTQNGKTIRKDSFKSHYIPVGDTAVYGPARTIPGPYFVIPTT